MTGSRSVKKSEPWRGSITIRVSAAFIIGLAVVCFVVAYSLAPDDKSRLIIEFAAKAIFGGAAIYSAYIAGTALWLNLVRDKQKVAHSILDALNASDMVEAKLMLDKEITDDTKPNEVYALIAADPSKAALARRLLGMYEDCAIAVQTEYADEATIFLSSGNSIIAYHDRLLPYIAGVREQGAQYRFYYVELDDLVNRWKYRKSGTTKKIPGALEEKSPRILS